MREEIGAGRFGPVYRADTVTGGAIVVKVFDQGLDADQSAALASALERICRAPLDHPGIVPVLETGVLRDCAWLAEPWLDATGLDEIMRRDGGLPLADVRLCVTQLAGALDYAAAVGLHHGALHPRDILVGPDRLSIAGVGVIEALGLAGLDVPMEGAYVSPQRASGADVSAGDDIYALAAITYELLTGLPVPPRGEIRSSLANVAATDRPLVADALEAALASDAAERPGSALAFAALLQAPVPVPAPVPVAPPPPAVEPVPEAVIDFAEEPVIVHAEPTIVHAEPTIVAATPPVEDFPLREREPASESALASELDLSDRSPAIEPPKLLRPEEPSSWNWFGMAAALAIGLLTGFAGGFVAGARDSTPSPRRAEQVTSRSERTPTPPPAERPAPTVGRDYTESDVAPAQPVTEQPVVPPPESPRQSVPANQAEPLRPTERPMQTTPADQTGTGPASLEVDSRPRGARVFIDGRLAGTTPLVIADVNPGTHAVRIDLVGHRRWVTSVDVTPGARQRVAASLER